MTVVSLTGLLPDHYQGILTGDASILDALPLGERGSLVIAETSDGLFSAPVVTGAGPLLRAAPTDGMAVALIELLTSNGPDRHGSFDIVRIDHRSVSPDAPERPMLVDQTHESVVVADRAVVKWAVRAEPTPAPTQVAHLAAAGFGQMPRPWGFVTWHNGEHHVLVASVVDYLDGASDGWTWAVADAGDFAAGRAAEASDLSKAAVPMREVGELVADLHTCLATSTAVIGSPVRGATSADVEQWQELAESLLSQAVDEMDGPEGARLRDRHSAIEATLRSIGDIESTAVIPVHGDLHVGQVLRWSGGYAVGDFDGNPVLAGDARLVPQPAARDVAGMLQSIDHVGRVVTRRVPGADVTRVEAWITLAQSEFLEAYQARMRENGVDYLLDPDLLLPFRVEQECREFLYAVRHLPRWRYVPDQALAALMDQTAGTN